ncbi:MAG TPA: hypothetical protein PLP56_00620 [Candidatus Omnitrophota bacterium]|nr:hypothetical protein [Candidatus Omnitrophota bacterium]
MRPIRLTILSILIVTAISAACCAQDFPGKILVLVDKKEVTIGEKVRYTIAVSAHRGIEVQFPDLSEAFKGLELIDSGETTIGFLNKRTRTLWAVLQSFAPGTYTIPGQRIRYKLPGKDWVEAVTGECGVTVISLVEKAGAGAQLADIKGPLDMRTLLPIVIAAVILLAALFLIFSKKIFWHKKKQAAAIQPWKAHEIAYARLEDLRKRGLIAHGMIKQYYSELSDILRHYLENRFSLKAPEMTTEEFINSMREYSELAREQKDLLKEFLTNCDLVKFAQYIPPENEGEAAFDTAKKFVDRTKAAEPPGAAAIDPPGAAATEPRARNAAAAGSPGRISQRTKS